MPTNQQKKSHTRLIIASTLFCASIAASVLISYLSHSSDSYWVTSHPLAQGVQITSQDLSMRKASLGTAKSGYLSQSSNPIGSVTRRAYAQGELLHISGLSANLEYARNESLSISIRAADIPPSVGIGEMVSLYQVHDVRNGETPIAPQLVISPVFIKEIERKGSNFGSEISVTISLNRSDVTTVLAATNSGRIVVVSTNG